MIIHDETTKSFIFKIRKTIKDIVQNEMHLKMQQSRIISGRMIYPLNVVVFEDNSKLGYFDSRFYELGISKKLMLYAKEEVLKNVIRHELAHFYTFITYGNIQAHGSEFREIAKKFLWGEEVYNAYANIEFENQKIQSDIKSEKLLEKIKKLLTLASSDNPHESELATLKANALLLEHNISSLDQSDKDEMETVYVQRAIEGTRKSSKHMCIYEILKTFYVSVVFNHGKGHFYLEVIGDKTSTDLAVYVAHFLDSHLEHLWKLTKKENPHLKSIAAKNAFFIGVSKGYTSKINEQKITLSKSNELMILENKLSTQLKFAYSRLGTKSMSGGMGHSDAKNIGVEKGKNLSINPGITNKIKTILKLN